MRAVRACVGLAVLSLGVGCSSWVPVQGATPVAYLEVTVDIPPDWNHFIWSQGAYLTRHGIELELITIRRWPRTAIVKGTNRSVRDGMLPQEIAELSLDSRRLDDGVNGLRVLENAPARIDGRDCFEIVYAYKNATGLDMKTREYGCVVGPWLYRFEFLAAAQYYFDAGQADFDRLAKSARFTVK